jgi:hypothetical protein
MTMRPDFVEAVDPRSGPAPWGIFLELLVIGAGAMLLFFRPGTADSVLSWGRLLLLAVPPFAGLLYLERRLSRGLRRRTLGTYPTTFPILMILAGVSILLVGAANRALPSHSRWVHPHLQGWVPVSLTGGNPMRGMALTTSTGWVAVVEPATGGGGTLHLPLSPQEVERVIADPTLEPELRVADGFLGVEYVAGYRLGPAPPPP